MESKEFESLITKYKKFLKYADDVMDLTGWDMCETPFFDFPGVMFDKVLDLCFEDEGKDAIYWWMFEKDGDKDMKMYEKDGTEIPTETITDLWNYVKDYRK